MKQLTLITALLLLWFCKTYGQEDTRFNVELFFGKQQALDFNQSPYISLSGYNLGGNLHITPAGRKFYIHAGIFAQVLNRTTSSLRLEIESVEDNWFLMHQELHLENNQQFFNPGNSSIPSIAQQGGLQFGAGYPFVERPYFSIHAQAFTGFKFSSINLNQTRYLKSVGSHNKEIRTLDFAIDGLGPLFRVGPQFRLKIKDGSRFAFGLYYEYHTLEGAIAYYDEADELVYESSKRMQHHFFQATFSMVLPLIN